MKTTILNFLGCGVLAVLAMACTDQTVESPAREQAYKKDEPVKQADTKNDVVKTSTKTESTQPQYAVNTDKEELQKRYDRLKADYDALSYKYESELNASPQTKLRNRLFGEGVVGKDLQFSYVTGKNAHAVYSKFINAVADNKENYTREDWDEVKVLYEALDTRKNEIEPQLSTRDNAKIATLKMRFSTLIAWNRPVSKVEENQLAKL